MEYILFVGAIVLLISVGYFLMGLFDLLLEKVLQYAAKKLYRKQTQEAIAQVLNKSLG
jgi:hypothetical protein